ncbi:MAG TPA: ORF6N domain-containing protein [Kofleriaceae bacterium]
MERIRERIHSIRGHHVVLDSDIAALYQVETKALVRAVQRNINRFPSDFMFQLTKEEFLRCQGGTSRGPGHGGRRYLPYAFTEQGVGMLASVLRSERAAQVNIQIVRAFVAMRQLLQSNDELRARLEELEKKYDGQFKVVFAAIRKLMAPGPTKPTRGFGR